MDEPWTIGRLLDWTAKFLAQKGSEFPRLDTEVLLSHALGCKRIELYTRYELRSLLRQLEWAIRQAKLPLEPVVTQAVAQMERDVIKRTY